MKRHSFTFIFIVLGLLVFHNESNAQKLLLDWVEIAENKIVVHYDLLDDDQSHLYRVHLYSSNDSFTNELMEVSGDGRVTIKPGKDRKLVWDIVKELGAFHGNLTFEIRATAFIPAVKSVNIDEGETFRRAKNNTISWVPGAANRRVTIELYKGSKLISADPNHFNTGSYIWHTPGSIKPGSNYSLRFVNVSDSTDTTKSHTFAIRRKVPLLVKAVIIAGIAGVAVLSSGGKSPGGGTTGTKLPGPPDPP